MSMMCMYRTGACKDPDERPSTSSLVLMLAICNNVAYVKYKSVYVHTRFIIVVAAEENNLKSSK